MKKRIDYIDIAKGIGILLVYVGHCNIGLGDDTFTIAFQWIYSFHMPFFFFVSGLLFKVKQVRTSDFLWKKSVTLILPYILFSFLNFTLLSLFHKCPGNILINGWGKNPLWFIPILYLCEVLHYFIRRGNIYLKIFSILPIVLCLLWKTTFNGWLPYSVSELAWFYMCFLSGSIFKSKIHILLNVNFLFVIMVIVIHLIVLFSIIIPYNENYRQQDDDVISYIMRYCIGMIGSLGLLMFSSQISKYKYQVGLKWLGRNTLVVLCTHKLYFDILQATCINNSLLGGVVTWILILLTIYIYNKWFDIYITTLKNKKI